MVAGFGGVLTQLTQEQADYLGVAVEGHSNLTLTNTKNLRADGEPTALFLKMFRCLQGFDMTKRTPISFEFFRQKLMPVLKNFVLFTKNYSN